MVFLSTALQSCAVVRSIFAIIAGLDFSTP